MTLQVNITEPGGGTPLVLKIEKLTYGIHRNVNTTGRRANKDQTKIMDHQASLLDISLSGILTTITDMEDLINAATSWWVGASDDSSDVTQLPTIQWRGRAAQYMLIDRLEITDISETGNHEFEYTLEIKVDTRTS